MVNPGVYPVRFGARLGIRKAVRHLRIGFCRVVTTTSGRGHRMLLAMLAGETEGRPIRHVTRPLSARSQAAREPARQVTADRVEGFLLAGVEMAEQRHQPTGGYVVRGSPQRSR